MQVIVVASELEQLSQIAVLGYPMLDHQFVGILGQCSNFFLHGFLPNVLTADVCCPKINGLFKRNNEAFQNFHNSFQNAGRRTRSP